MGRMSFRSSPHYCLCAIARTLEAHNRNRVDGGFDRRHALLRGRNQFGWAHVARSQAIDDFACRQRPQLRHRPAPSKCAPQPHLASILLCIFA
jgi:hypothetical protein